MVEVRDAFYRLSPYIVDSSPDSRGEIDFSGRRFVFFHTEMFARLFEEMEDVAGPVIKSRIKQFGIEAGRTIGKKMDAEFEDTSTLETLRLIVKSGFQLSDLKAIAETDDKSQFEKILGYGTFVGWFGDAEVHEYEGGEIIKVETWNNFESHSYGETGGKQCKFVLGVLQGIMSHFWDEENLESEETRCACEGGDSCVMVVRNGA